MKPALTVVRASRDRHRVLTDAIARLDPPARIAQLEREVAFLRSQLGRMAALELALELAGRQAAAREMPRAMLVD
jgi:hypothetical protein